MGFGIAIAGGAAAAGRRSHSAQQHKRREYSSSMSTYSSPSQTRDELPEDPMLHKYECLCGGCYALRDEYMAMHDEGEFLSDVGGLEGLLDK